MGLPGCINTYQKGSDFNPKAQKLAPSQTPVIHHRKPNFAKMYIELLVLLPRKNFGLRAANSNNKSFYGNRPQIL